MIDVPMVPTLLVCESDAGELAVPVLNVRKSLGEDWREGFVSADELMDVFEPIMDKERAKRLFKVASAASKLL